MEVEFISQGKVVYTGHITEKIHLLINNKYKFKLKKNKIKQKIIKLIITN